MPKPIELVNDRFERARSYRVTHQDEIWKRSYNNWKGVLDKSLFPWRSKLFIPWSFTVVETIIPRVFSRDPKWIAMPQNPDFDPESSRVVSDLLKYQWGRLGMRLKMYDYIKDSLMYSKGIMKVGWKFQHKNKTIMEPEVGEDDKITFNRVTKSDVEWDDPVCEVVDPMDLYIDPDATGDSSTWKFCIHRKTVELEELKENPNYKNVNKIKQASYADQYMDNSRYQTAPPKDKHKDLVEILEYWEEDRLIVVANRGIVLRDDPNPYNHKRIPFVDLDDYRDPHRLYGHSELSVIDPLQREINSIRNQRRDYDNLALNPVVLMVPGTLRNPNSAVMAPGNIWNVTDLNSMDVLQLPLLQGVSSEIEERTAEDIRRTVAIDEIGIGLLPANPQRRSATEVSTSQNSAGRRFAMKIALLEDSVKRIGEMIFALNQQFLDRERMIQIVGARGQAEWVELSPEDIRGGWNIAIEAGSMLPKDEIAQRQEAVELIQYLSPLIAPIVQTSPQVLMPIIRMVTDTFDLPTKDEVLRELEEALQQPQAQSEEQAQAETANTEAQAISSLFQGGGAEPPVV